jgi:alkanesulfonate monooxygenase SsuD/methylene tetrahydromethanopterin reductase-like flavin-dependent oxidoreductase (luciferase family)
MAYFDPLTLLPALAVVTTRVGLCATATTSYNETLPRCPEIRLA